MRRLVIALTAAALIATGAGIPAPATASSPTGRGVTRSDAAGVGVVGTTGTVDALARTGVRIGKLKNRTAPYGKKVTIRPKASAKWHTKILSKRLTVKKGKRTVARNRASVRLRAGTYKVTTRVRYRTYRKVAVRRTSWKTVVTVPAFSETTVRCVPSGVSVQAAASALDDGGIGAVETTTSEPTPETTTTTEPTTTDPVTTTTDPVTTTTTDPVTTTTTDPVTTTTDPVTTTTTDPVTTTTTTTTTTRPTTTTTRPTTRPVVTTRPTTTTRPPLPDEAFFDATCTGSAFDGSVVLGSVAAARSGSVWTGLSWDGDLLRFSTVPVSGTAFTATLQYADDLTKRIRTTRTVTETRWSSTKSASRTQKLTIKAGKRPSRVPADADGECPSWAPIKGNINASRGTKIYHLPGGRWYDVTKAEECFSTVSAAEKAGYRPSENG